MTPKDKFYSLITTVGLVTTISAGSPAIMHCWLKYGDLPFANFNQYACRGIEIKIQPDNYSSGKYQPTLITNVYGALSSASTSATIMPTTYLAEVDKAISSIKLF